MKKIVQVLSISAFFCITSCQRSISEEAAMMDENVLNDTRIANTFIVSFSPDYLIPLKGLDLQFDNREIKRTYAEKYRNDMIKEIQSFLAEMQIQQDKIIYYYTSTTTGFAATLTPAEYEKLRNDYRIWSIDNDMIVKLPDYVVESTEQGSSRAQTTPCGITNAGGFADGSTKTTWIWIIDSGADTDHPDLNVNVSSPYATYFVGGSLEDCLGHGTHVSGTAAAKDNGLGVVGVSAGATIVPVRVFDCSGSTATSTVVAAMDHVGTYDITGDCCNLSLSGYFGGGCSTSYSGKTSLENLSAGGTFVSLAAGNNYGANAGLYGPACVNATNVMTVASMTCGKAFSSFSNKGKPPIDWIATGSNVYSTYLSGGYATLSGTSMAAPTVAGVCHARAGLPISGGTVVKSGVSYSIAKR
ncbi:MAG: S8 family serine peptidase [Chitinophagales bacterium]|nr:S8 family serine peptidase [Chitinophagales bacterium]